MNASENCLKLLRAFEGLVDGDKSTPNYEPYICPANIYTVGYGHALYTSTGQQINVGIFGKAKALQLARNAMQWKFGKQAITEQEAETLLQADAANFAVGLNKRIASNTTQEQFDALLLFSFNVGLGNFDTSSVKRLHNQGKRDIGTISMRDLCNKAKAKASPTTMPLAFVRWCNANGQFSLGIFRRRLAEVLVYSGWDADQAYRAVMSFHD